MQNLSNYKLWIIGLLWIILSNSGCCPCDDPSNKDCPNYDPCHDVKAPVASFGAGYLLEYEEYQGLNGFHPDTTIYLDGDTIPGTCTFYAYTEDVDSFYWKVGDDPRTFRGKQFYLEFDDPFRKQTINVELQTVKYSDCFEGGSFRDTVSRSLFVSARPFESPSLVYFNNKYWGASTEFPNDSFEIEFVDWTESRIVNFPRGTYGRALRYRRDYDEVYFTGQHDSIVWMGHAKFQPDDRRKVVIRYMISYDLGKTQNWYTYTGYRRD